MQVVYLLTPMPVAVDDQPVPILSNPLLLSQFPGYKQHSPGDLLIVLCQVVSRGNKLVGDNQHVSRRSRVNIAKGGHQVILIQDIAR